MVKFSTKLTTLNLNLRLFILKLGCYTGSAFKLGGTQGNNNENNHRGELSFSILVHALWTHRNIANRAWNSFINARCLLVSSNEYHRP